MDASFPHASIYDDEDTNPFQTEAESAPPPPASSSSNVDLDDTDEPPTPPATAQRPSFPTPQPSYVRPQQPKNRVGLFLQNTEDVEILITDALKTTEGSTAAYIAYVIRTGNIEARRRYSEFESLRNSLVKLYPTLIIPPIPSKQSISDYAVKQAKAKEDATMIARRKRMLQVFLNRILRHAILSNEGVFHRFLDGEVSWSEVLHSPPISLLPKNILKAPSHNPTDMSVPAYNALPSPSAAQPLRQPDQRFLDSEVFTNKFSSHLSGSMEKVTRRTMKRWSEYSTDHADLGAALNAFSLSESGALASSIEKTGQAVDATYMSTARLLQDLEQSWTEPLHEYTQFADIIKKLLVYRHQKHVQYEMTQDALENKRETLEDLEKSEAEAQRLAAALGTASNVNGVLARGAEADAESSAARPSDSVPRPRSQSQPSSPRRLGNIGLLSALSHSLHGMMDVDPETARRSSISKTREAISQLEDGLHVSAQDLKYASSTIQADLDRFQRQKVADLREMAIAMARIHKEWCRKNLEAWEEAKREIGKIEPHPNRPPPDEPGLATPPAPSPARPGLSSSGPNGLSDR